MGIGIERSLQTFSAKYFEFPKKQEIIIVEQYKAYAYVSKEEVDKRIKNFSDHVNLNQFDAVMVNLTGGLAFAQDLIRLQGYKRKIFEIKYHPNGEAPIRILQPFRNLNIGIIEDVQDTTRTTQLIRRDAPFASMLYLVKKRIPNQPVISNSACAMEVDNRWLLGKGMNGDIPGDGMPRNWGRSYEGIAVKIQS